MLYELDQYGTITAWDLVTRTCRQLERPFLFRAVQALYSLANGQIVRLDSPRLARSNPRQAATVLDAKDGHDLGGLEWQCVRHSGPAHVTPEGRLFYLRASADQIIVWNLLTRQEETSRTIPGARNSVRHFDLSQDQRIVAVTNKLGETTVCDWAKGPELRNPRTFPSAVTARISPDGNTLVLFHAKPQHVALWDIPTQQLRKANIPCRTAEMIFAFNPILPVFVAINRDKLLTLFSTETGDAIRSVDFGVGRSVQCVCFSPDGLTCAVGGSNKQFAVFDVDL
jgi:WD40 repeat protein